MNNPQALDLIFHCTMNFILLHFLVFLIAEALFYPVMLLLGLTDGK